MNDAWRSVLLGTAGLWVAVGLALALTFSRSPRDHHAAPRRRLVGWLLACTTVQAAHFGEEWATGFQRLWPQRLDLAPWSDAFFVSFNLVWLAVWLVAAAGIRAGQRWAWFPAWLLALAAMVNGLAHPLLAVSAGGYFPGLWTSPILGIAGVLLFRELRQCSSPSTRLANSHN